MRPGHSEESCDGDDSLCSSNNYDNSSTSTRGADNAHLSGDGGGEDSISSGTRFAQQSCSLTATPEEEGESSDESDGSSNSGETATERDGRGSQRVAAEARRRRRQRSSPESEGTDTSSDSENNGSKIGGGGRDAREERNGPQPIGRQNQRGEIDGIPDPSIVDWEVAVVMAATSADDMVSVY